jgi:tRNA pseudouridine13 synthase
VKLKRTPEDFQVEELTDVAPADGPFALYRLTKRSMGTPEVIDAVVRRWGIPRRAISFGGLKDRHALTAQHVTIHRGPRRELAQSSFRLEYLGQAPKPFEARDIRANRFRVAIRDLAPDALAGAERAFDEAARDGIPNYFDDQRFGSLGQSREFIAKAWCEGNFERALWLAIADANEHDRPDDRAAKRLLRESWGRWARLKAELPKSSRRSTVTYLADHPDDFRGAFARQPAELRSLWLAAFQSRVWNQALAAVVRGAVPARRLIPIELDAGPIALYGPLEERERAALAVEIPLPSARAQGPWRPALERAALEAGLALERMRIRHPRENFFSKGLRAAVVAPAGASREAAADEFYPKRKKLTLAFDLPRGAYATILVKRVTRPPGA